MAGPSAPNPILVSLWPLEDTRTPERACYYVAECEIDGRRYSARSRSGASAALARELVAAGVSEGPMIIRHRGLKGEMRLPSLFEAAKWTTSEGQKALARVRWTDLAKRFSDNS